MKTLIFSILVFISATTSGATAQKQTDLFLGILEIPDGVTIVVINSNNEHITIESTEKALKLPVGRYRVDHWIMERKDEEGNLWKLKGQHLGRKGHFIVTESRPANPAIGEPVISMLTATKKDDFQYSFRQDLKGRLGESIEITINEKRPEAPKLHVKNKGASYQETFNFSYG